MQTLYNICYIVKYEYIIIYNIYQNIIVYIDSYNYTAYLINYTVKLINAYFLIMNIKILKTDWNITADLMTILKQAKQEDSGNK